MGFNRSASSTWENRWIRIPSDDGAYAAIAYGVTIRSAVGQVAFAGPSKKAVSVVRDGYRVETFDGRWHPDSRSSFPAVLYLRTVGKSLLPFEFEVHQNGHRSTVTFSKWNERTVVTVPARSTPIGATKLETRARVTA
jgi:hypothetical protein